MRRHSATKCVSRHSPFEAPLFKDHRENSYFGRSVFATLRVSPSDQLLPSGGISKKADMSFRDRVSEVIVRYAYASFSTVLMPTLFHSWQVLRSTRRTAGLSAIREFEPAQISRLQRMAGKRAAIAAFGCNAQGRLRAAVPCFAQPSTQH